MDSWLDREIIHDGKLFIYKGPDHASIRDLLDMLEDSEVFSLYYIIFEISKGINT